MGLRFGQATPYAEQKNDNIDGLPLRQHMVDVNENTTIVTSTVPFCLTNSHQWLGYTIAIYIIAASQLQPSHITSTNRNIKTALN